MNYYDVNSLSELPAPPKGFRFFDFIGGEKELRCFLTPEDIPRNLFIEENEEILDECLKPIYKHKGICVKQDASYALPGFYIISPTKHFRSLDEVDEVTHQRIFFILREIRKAMREVLKIDHVHLYYEEKSNKSCNVHYWILPITNIDQHPRLYNFEIKSYLDQFLFSKEREKIKFYNKKMRAFLIENHLIEKDENFLEKITSS